MKEEVNLQNKINKLVKILVTNRILKRLTDMG